MKSKTPYDQALKLANKFIGLIQSSCERVEIAGSLRRKKKEVGDIELVAIPRYEIIEYEKEINNGLLNFLPNKQTTTWRTQIDHLEQKVKELYQSSIITEFIKNGEKFKSFIAFNIQFDLFITTQEQWGVIFMIRTGSKNYSHQFMIELNKRGQYKIKNGYLWRVVKRGYQKFIIPVPEEKDLYDLVGLPYLPPEQRIKAIFPQPNQEQEGN
jgi:DNA polymerase/3'-5' exonuclease PolX